ncbi:acyltransferase [Sphingomonas sp. BK580]|uniref:acyltransferase family protein n=1 Tax=Sphingomonas sp. BK580 TaxID=2586972 RepID=UPI001615DEE4|nr:acyltransferase [Sphingomonas sp. BK580]MBB3695787.1 peptidoglycan/LPS O-acetylase OafA/YrhL [Sphingomonas sp. BK580]
MKNTGKVADEYRLPSRFATLEAGRFVAAFGVVLFHASITTALPKYLGFFAMPILAGGFSGVEFFFVLSGFVIVLAHRRELIKDNNSLAILKEFAWKRFSRVYPVLWALLLVLVPAMLMIPQLQWRPPVTHIDILTAFTIAPVPVERILAVEWTLRYEVLFYGVVGLALWKRKLGVAAISALIVCATASFIFKPGGLAAFFIAPYHLLFIAGGSIAFAAAAKPLRGGRIILTTGAAIFLWRLAVCAAHPEQRAATFWDTAFFGAGAALIVYGLVALETRRSFRVPSWTLYLGKASYSIYLAHFPVVSLAAKLGLLVGGRSAPLLYVAGIAATSTAAGVLFFEVVEKRVAAFLQRIKPRFR